VTKLKPIEIAAEIVASFVSNNSLPRAELATLLEAVHGAVKRLAEGAEVAPVVIDAPTPAVSVRKSVSPDYLICLDDGKRFKSLRRHLATLGMTPEQYRAKWDLPSTYPMVAPNYAAQRSALAKTIGLGQLREKPVVSPPASAATSEVVAPAPARSVADEVAAAPRPSVEAVTPEPPTVTKRKAAEVPVKRKPGRPRKVTA
jgi:MucR family transcriptional regulator, transcriptional regulator of exopolysaccharide biosynthesis